MFQLFEYPPLAFSPANRKDGTLNDAYAAANNYNFNVRGKKSLWRKIANLPPEQIKQFRQLKRDMIAREVRN